MASPRRTPRRPRSAWSPLVSPAWLKEHLHDGPLRIVDIRWSLQGPPGRQLYEGGHIPGAVFVDLERDVTASAGPGRHPIPSADQFAAAMSRAGIGDQTEVVAYDDSGGSIAARLWWLAGFFGHPRQVRVLDGGLSAWIAAGGASAREPPDVRPESYTATALRRGVVDKHHVAERLRRRDAVVLDARATERFEGRSEPIDARPGHVPGAVSAPWSQNLESGRFRSPKELRKRFEALGVRPSRRVICYCGSGVTACHDLLALELAGYSPRALSLYEGSWSDWARDTGRAAATGP